MEASETTATAPPPVPSPEPSTPEPAPEPTAPAPEQPEPGVEPTDEPAPEQPEQPAGEGPDLSDAQADLRAIRSGLERAGLDLGEEQPVEPWERLSGAAEPEAEYDEPGYDQPQPGEPQQPLTEEQRYQQQFREAVSEAVRNEVDPYLANLEMQRREEQIQSFAEQHPRMKDPEVLDAVEGRLQRLAQKYGPSALTDPDLVSEAYYAHEARRAAAGQQTSTGAAAPEQSAAEAVGQPQGVTLETGAGPGAPPPSADPQEAMYHRAIQEADNPWKRSPSESAQ